MRSQESLVRRKGIQLSTIYSSLITHHSLLITHHSSLITHYSSLITHHSLLITHHSSLITHHSLLITHYSSLITHHSLLINCPLHVSRYPIPLLPLIIIFRKFASWYFLTSKNPLPSCMKNWRS